MTSSGNNECNILCVARGLYVSCVHVCFVMSIVPADHMLALPCTEENPQSDELVENEDSHTLCKLRVCVTHVYYFVVGECL